MSLKISFYFIIFINLGIAQNVQVSSIKKVTELENGEYFHPKFKNSKTYNSRVFRDNN